MLYIMKPHIYNIFLVIFLIFVIYYYLINDNLNKRSEKILVLVIIAISTIIILYNWGCYNKEHMTPQSNEAVQDIASIYNNSGTLTIPNLVVTGNATFSGTTTLGTTNAMQHY